MLWAGPRRVDRLISVSRSLARSRDPSKSVIRYVPRRKPPRSRCISRDFNFWLGLRSRRRCGVVANRRQTVCFSAVARKVCFRLDGCRMGRWKLRWCLYGGLPRLLHGRGRYWVRPFRVARRLVARHASRRHRFMAPTPADHITSGCHGRACVANGILLSSGGCQRAALPAKNVIRYSAYAPFSKQRRAIHRRLPEIGSPRDVAMGVVRRAMLRSVRVRLRVRHRRPRDDFHRVWNSFFTEPLHLRTPAAHDPDDLFGGYETGRTSFQLGAAAGSGITSRRRGTGLHRVVS